MTHCPSVKPEAKERNLVRTNCVFAAFCNIFLCEPCHTLWDSCSAKWIPDLAIFIPFSCCGLRNISVPIPTPNRFDAHVPYSGPCRLSDCLCRLVCITNMPTPISLRALVHNATDKYWYDHVEATGLCTQDSTNSDTQTKQAVAKQPRPLIWHRDKVTAAKPMKYSYT